MESLNGKLSDELFNREVFETLMGKWRRKHNQRRPHSALGYRPPAPGGQLPRSLALDPIPWSGFQWVQDLTSRVVPLMGAGQSVRRSVNVDHVDRLMKAIRIGANLRWRNSFGWHPISEDMRLK